MTRVGTTPPTPERRQHGAVQRASTVQDAHGRVGCPWHVQSLLHSLLAKKHISPPQYAAGNAFTALFHEAGIPKLRAQDLAWKPKASAPHHAATPGAERAYRLLTRALDALGGLDAPTGSLAFSVLGLGDSLTLWSATQCWTPPSATAAKGVLISALELLAQHFGLTKAAYR